MNHSELRELLPWYVNSTLVGQELKALKTHLKQCPDCRGELDEMRSLQADIKTFGESTPEPSSGSRDLGLNSILGNRQPRKNVLTPALVTPWAFALLFLGLSTHLWMRVGGLEAPRSISSVVLSQARSEPRLVELRESDRAFVVEIDINDPRPYVRYSCEILNEAGSRLALFHEDGPRRTLSLLLPSSGFPDGQRLTLLVGGHMKEGDSPELLGRYHFLLKRN